MSRRAVLVLGFCMSLGVVFQLASCGQRICVAGIGDCAITSTPKNKDTQVGDKKFTLVTSKSEIFEGERLEINAENVGGKWEIKVTEGPVGNLEQNDDSVIFVAAASIANSYAWTTLKAKDTTRYKSDADTPLAFDEIKIKTKKKAN